LTCSQWRQFRGIGSRSPLCCCCACKHSFKPNKKHPRCFFLIFDFFFIFFLHTPLAGWFNAANVAHLYVLLSLFLDVSRLKQRTSHALIRLERELQELQLFTPDCGKTQAKGNTHLHRTLCCWIADQCCSSSYHPTGLRLGLAISE
jgi:hypothetical protein